MSEKEIVDLLLDLYNEYGVHINLTTGERHQIEMWLEAKRGGEE